MSKFKPKTIQELADDIDLIIADKAKETKYSYTTIYLDGLLENKLSYADIELFCQLILKIATTKNRILRHIEHDYWQFANRLPLHLLMQAKLKIKKDEELLTNADYKNPTKKNLARLLNLAEEVLALKADDSKGSELRRSEAIKIINKLNLYYYVPHAKDLFVASINCKNLHEQRAALEGLEIYYQGTDEEIDHKLIQILNAIKDKTEDRFVMLACLQILTLTDVIDEGTAMGEMDDWDDAMDKKMRRLWKVKKVNKK